jgi:hypothetical protein
VWLLLFLLLLLLLLLLLCCSAALLLCCSAALLLCCSAALLPPTLLRSSNWFQQMRCTQDLGAHLRPAHAQDGAFEFE